MNKKKWASYTAVLMLSLGLVACSNDSEEVTDVKADVEKMDTVKEQDAKKK